MDMMESDIYVSRGKLVISQFGGPAQFKISFRIRCSAHSPVSIIISQFKLQFDFFTGMFNLFVTFDLCTPHLSSAARPKKEKAQQHIMCMLLMTNMSGSECCILVQIRLTDASVVIYVRYGREDEDAGI